MSWPAATGRSSTTARSAACWQRPCRVRDFRATSRKPSRPATVGGCWAWPEGRAIALDLLALAQRDVAHRARREQFIELDAARGQALLERVLQQRLDGRPVLLDPVG